MNSTPLYEVSSDPNDRFPVTPNSILTMKDEGMNIPLDNFSEKDILAYGKARWRRVQYLADQFWTSWRRGYLSTLQQRTKWTLPSQNLQVDDVVLIKDRSSPRNKWPMGRILSTKKSKDDLVRSVTLSLKPHSNGAPRTLERSIHDLVLLVRSEPK